VYVAELSTFSPGKDKGSPCRAAVAAATSHYHARLRWTLSACYLCMKKERLTPRR
jgi:hypothetical protein